jgi:multiple sugar transport system substrate-binding protein
MLRIALRQYGPFESAIRKQWESFDGRQGHTMELEALDLGPLHARLFANHGLRNGDVDIALVCTDWIAEAAATGALANLAPELQSNPPAGYPDAWTDSLLRFQRLGPRFLGLPYHDGPECLIYRTDLVSPAQLPATWDDFHRLARSLTRPERKLWGTAFAAFPDGHNTVYDFCLQLWTRGGELFDPAGRPTLDTPAAARALEFLRALLNDPAAVHPASRQFDSVKSGLAFAAGEVGLMVNWFGFATLPETQPGSPLKGKVAIAPLPCTPPGRPASLNVYWILGIGAGSRNRDLAWRFLRHAASPAMDRLLTLEGAIGCRKSTWHDPEVNRAIPFFHHLEQIHQGARELPRLTEWTRLAETIDALVVEAINTRRPVAELTRKAQARLAGFKNR